MEGILLEKKQLKEMSGRELIHKLATKKARLCVLDVKIEKAKESFKYYPKPEDDVQKFILEPLIEESEKLMVQYSQLWMEISRREPRD